MRKLAKLAVAMVMMSGGLVWGQQAEKDESKELKVGMEAPDFTLNNQDGKSVRLSSFKGKKWVVLAFFPKANTSG